MQAFRRPFTGFASLKRRTSLPGLTMAQAEALDAIHFYAEDNCIPVVFHKGDLVLLNNHCVVHARDKTDLRVEDGETNTVSTESPQTKRHLLKMFVRDQDRAWPVPEELKRDWEVLYGLRGKTKEDRVETFRMVPQTEGKLANGWTQNG